VQLTYARKLVFRVSAVFKLGIAENMCTVNPATAQALALPRMEKAPAHRKALPYPEVASCIEAVKASGAGRSTKLALEFLVLTASRSGEVRAATWDEFDLGDRATRATCATWEIPASRMKAKKPHRVPLSARAVEILREVEKLADGSGLVFPGTKQGKALSDMTLSKLVRGPAERDGRVSGTSAPARRSCGPAGPCAGG
jgi:integrase